MPPRAASAADKSGRNCHDYRVALVLPISTAPLAGRVQLLGEVQITSPRRALVMVLEEPAAVPGEIALLAEAALAADWNRPEEDAAWTPLQPGKTFGGGDDPMQQSNEYSHDPTVFAVCTLWRGR